MKRAGGNGKWWLLFVVALGLALWVRLRNRSDDTPAGPTPPAQTAPAQPAPIDAAAGRGRGTDRDVGRTEPTKPGRARAVPLRIPDRRAVVRRHAPLVSETSAGFAPKRLRVVDIATGTVEADIAYHAYGGDGSDQAALVDEMIRTRAALRGFPLGAGPLFAATADGTAGVLASGDALLVMRGDKIGAALAVPAGYAPRIVPRDGTVLFRGYEVASTIRASTRSRGRRSTCPPSTSSMARSTTRAPRR